MFAKNIRNIVSCNLRLALSSKMELNNKHPLIEISPNAVEDIRKTYNLDNGRIEEAVEILENWVKKQEHFRNKNYSRRYLELALIAGKGSVEKAKMQIEKICTLKTLLPKFFISSGVKSTCEAVNENAQIVMLPKITKDYRRVCVFQMNDKEFKTSTYLEFYRIAIVLSEYSKAHDYIDGFIIIEDFRTVNLVDLVTKVNFLELQQFVTIITEGFGARLKGIHVITKSKAIDIFVKAMKQVLSQKLANRVHVHPEVEELHKVVDKEILPVDFGGEERSIKELQDDWIKLLCSEEHEKYLELMKGTDESLRQTDNFNDLYMGISGSFRTLTVD